MPPQTIQPSSHHPSSAQLRPRYDMVRSCAACPRAFAPQRSACGSHLEDPASARCWRAHGGRSDGPHAIPESAYPVANTWEMRRSVSPLRQRFVGSARVVFGGARAAETERADVSLSLRLWGLVEIRLVGVARAEFVLCPRVGDDFTTCWSSDFVDEWMGQSRAGQSRQCLCVLCTRLMR